MPGLMPARWRSLLAYDGCTHAPYLVWMVPQATDLRVALLLWPRDPEKDYQAIEAWELF
jgi:hypothetical protein